MSLAETYTAHPAPTLAPPPVRRWSPDRLMTIYMVGTAAIALLMLATVTFLVEFLGY